MVSDKDTHAYLRSQILQSHVRLGELMDERLATAEAEDLEKYFAVLSRLVGKLEDTDKTLKVIAREMVGETAAMIMSELAD